MKIIVTGGAGFIGSHLADRCVAEGHEAVIIDDLSTGLRENLNPEATFVEMDIRDRDGVFEVFGRKEPQAVYPAPSYMPTVPAGSVDVVQAPVRIQVESVSVGIGVAEFTNPIHLRSFRVETGPLTLALVRASASLDAL